MRSVLTEIVLSMGFKVEKVKEEEKAILELKFKYIIFPKKRQKDILTRILFVFHGELVEVQVNSSEISRFE